MKKTRSPEYHSFRDGIEKIFGRHLIADYEQDRSARTLRFEVGEGYDDITFEKLQELSQLLRTNKINLSKSYVANEGCESCGHGHAVNLPISCSDVVFPAEFPCLFMIFPGPGANGNGTCGVESTNTTKRLCDKHAPLRCDCGKQALRAKGYFVDGTPVLDALVCNSCG